MEPMDRPRRQATVPLAPPQPSARPLSAAGGAPLLPEPAGGLRAVDQSLEALSAILAAEGQLENTILVFTSDNGFNYGKHPATKGDTHEASLRVPLVFAGPGIAAGQQEQAIALNTDLLPTLAEFAGAPLAAPLEGRSLVPFLRGEEPSGWRREFPIEFTPAGPTGSPPAFRGVRSSFPNGAVWKYVEYPTENVTKLYHVTADPHELRNPADSTDPAVQAARASLAERLRATTPRWSPNRGGEGATAEGRA